MVSDQLRDAIERECAQKSLYQIAKGSGVDWSAVRRFMTGERPDLRMGTVDRLCDYLGLELRPKQRAKKGKRAGKQALKK